MKDVLRILMAVSLLALGSPAQAVKRRVFITSVTGKGNLGSWSEGHGQTGQAAGDAICRARAAAASLPNATTYRAWLSTSGNDAYCHVQGLTGTVGNGCDGIAQPGGGPWSLRDGVTPFSGSLDELTATNAVIYRPVASDEYGDPIDNLTSFVWTGTHADGTATSDDCNGWKSITGQSTGLVGSPVGSTQIWTDYHDIGFGCSGTFHLLCFEPGESEAPDTRWTEPAALAFTTSASGNGDLSSWPDAGGQTGLDAGDAICRAVAARAALPAPDSFVAWLSSSTIDARDRLVDPGPGIAFKRLDGFTVATSKADLIDNSNAAPFNVDEHGRYFATDSYSWTGTFGDGTGDRIVPANCNDWSSTAPEAGQADLGDLASAGSTDWTFEVNDYCSASYHLMCLSGVVTIFLDGFDLSGDTSRWSFTSP